jgi:hypothetical protein
MTADVFIVVIGGRDWFWIMDGLNPRADRTFLNQHPEALLVTDAHTIPRLVQYLTGAAATPPDGLIS